MLKMNLKALASGFAALALTMALSWTFVDATNFTRSNWGGGAGQFASAISVLVR